VTKAYINFSVHEGLFHRMAERLRAFGVTEFAGFAWGKAQQQTLSNVSIKYDLLVFTQDLLPKHGDAPPDLAWLQQRERELGVSIERMLSAERHLLAGRTWEQIMRMVEVALREIAATYDRVRPDFVFSDDVSCFHSYAHFVLARERGIPFWCIGGARLPYRVAIYSEGLQHWEGVTARYAEYRRRGLTPQERAPAEEYAKAFRDKPNRPSGMAVRAGSPGFGRADLATLRASAMRYWSDPDDPTSMPPWQAIPQRVRRVARIRGAKLLKVFEQPVDGEKYVLYPIHFQPEASTLVQAPMYLDQLALIQDIARSLPIGHRLYVKEHLSNRGRRPLEFYNAIRAIPSVRLLGPDANTWALIQNASAVAVITGTMGWEALFFDKPVITFGDVFYNAVPTVYRAGLVPKDGWYEVFQRAITSHVPDREALITYLAAMQAASFPGFIANPATFPEVILEENIDLLVHGLVTAAGLASATSRAPSAALSHPHR
jgi:hypothetical protein